MKKLRPVFLLVLLCILFTLPARAADPIAYPVEGGNIYFDSDTCTITGADKTVTAADIPASINGIPVVFIGRDAFFECYHLSSVTIPASVSEIGIQAFDSCISLTSVVIPNSVTKLGIEAFAQCSSLTSVTIPASVTKIGIQAFESCISLKSVTIPGTAADIGIEAFAQCTSLSSVTISGVAADIGIEAFAYCSSLSTVTISGAAADIGIEAFAYCTSLSSVTLSDSLSRIGAQAFAYCISLPSVTIPDSVASVGEEAFLSCTSLSSVTVGKSVKSFGKDVFLACPSLTDIYFKGDAPAADSIFLPSGVTLHYTPGTSGWTDSTAYDSAAGTWNGYLLKALPLPFTDIAEGDTFYSDILWAYDHGLMSGKTATTFDRKANLTRQQVWRVLYRLLNNEDAGSMAGAKAWAMEKGISDGLEPGKAATRQEVVTMLWRALGSPAADLNALNGYTDAVSIGGPPRAAMAWAIKHGLVSGYADGTLRPNATITRGAFAALLHRQLS